MTLEIIASQQLKATLRRLLASDDGRVALDAAKFVVKGDVNWPMMVRSLIAEIRARQK